MDAGRCVGKGGVPHAGICPGTSNIQCCNTVFVSLRNSTSTPNNNHLLLTDLADFLQAATTGFDLA